MKLPKWAERYFGFINTMPFIGAEVNTVDPDWAKRQGSDGMYTVEADGGAI